MPWEDVEARKEQALILANQKLIKCAKKMAQIAYGKVTIAPDPSAPLKKSIGIYKTPWYDIVFLAKVKEIRKRKYDYQDHYSRYQYGIFCKAYYMRETKDYNGGLVMEAKTSYILGKINTRSPKHFLAKLLEFEQAIDRSITVENESANEEITRKKLVNDARRTIKGLVCRNGTYFIGDNEIREDTSWSNVSLNNDGTIKMRNLSLSVDQFNQLTALLGWRKEDTTNA